MKAYANIAKQREQSVKCMNKVLLAEQEATKSILQAVVDRNQIHYNCYTGLSNVFQYHLTYLRLRF